MAITINKNMWTGDVPSTPSTNSAIDFVPTATRQILELSRSLGLPVGYLQEQGGKVVQDIFPIKTLESEQISNSSKVDLYLHTESAFHPYRPDYVMLLCLRGDPSAETTYVDVGEMFSSMPESMIFALSSPYYETSVDPSFMQRGEKNSVVRTPIFKFSEKGHISMIYDQQLMTAINTQGEIALGFLNDLITQHTKKIVLEKGDLLVMDNRTTIHGRTSFIPRYDGTDRWLKRLSVIEVLPPEGQFMECLITGETIITTQEFANA